MTSCRPRRRLRKGQCAHALASDLRRPEPRDDAVSCKAPGLQWSWRPGWEGSRLLAHPENLRLTEAPWGSLCARGRPPPSEVPGAPGSVCLPLSRPSRSHKHPTRMFAGAGPRARPGRASCHAGLLPCEGPVGAASFRRLHPLTGISRVRINCISYQLLRIEHEKGPSIT